MGIRFASLLVSVTATCLALPAAAQAQDSYSTVPPQ
jgi:hypothetical protein